MQFDETKTYVNLARSFAGESQAGMRYQLAARLAIQQGYATLAETIRTLAKNETVHARRFFEELSRCLRKKEIESANYEDKRLEVFLHGQPVLFVSPANDVFLLPAGSKNEEASELYHQVAVAADEVYSYVEAMQNAPLLHERPPAPCLWPA